MTLHQPAFDAAPRPHTVPTAAARLARRIAGCLVDAGRWLLAHAAPGPEKYELSDRDLADLNLRRWQIEADDPHRTKLF
jgi:hypothetical protein